MTEQNPASPDGETLHDKLQRLATWLEVAETNFGGLPEGVSIREVWMTMRQAALASAPRPDGERVTDEMVMRFIKSMLDNSELRNDADLGLTAVIRPECHIEIVRKSLIAALASSAPRPDADAKLAEIEQRHCDLQKLIEGEQIKPSPYTVEAHADRGSLLTTASEALQECERLRVQLTTSEIDNFDLHKKIETLQHELTLASRALGAAK